MTSKADKEVIEDEKAAEKAYQRKRGKTTEAQTTELDVVQPGCSEPDTVPPSVVGTSQDPNRPTDEV